MGAGVTFRIGDRRTGKTTAILEWLKKNPDGIVVSANFQQARILHSRAVDEGMDVSVTQFRSSSENLRGLNKKVAIDEAQWLLQMLYPTLDFATMTGNVDNGV